MNIHTLLRSEDIMHLFPPVMSDEVEDSFTVLILWQYIMTIYSFIVLWQYIMTIHRFTVLWQYIMAIHSFTVLWQYIMIIHSFTVLWQCIMTIHTLLRSEDIMHLFPPVMSDQVEDSFTVLWPHKYLILQLLGGIDGDTWCDKRHVEGFCIGLDCRECSHPVYTKHHKDSILHLITHWK